MKKVMVRSVGVLMLMFFLSTYALAHTPLCSCYDNGDGTITCEGGFSDGSSAAGVDITLQSKGGTVLQKGKMNEDSSFTFKKPGVAYKVIFDAGPGHVVEVSDKDITE